MKVLFLTVAGKQGNGHIVRCLSISSALKKRGISTSFIIDADTSLIKKKIIF